MYGQHNLNGTWNRGIVRYVSIATIGRGLQLRHVHEWVIISQIMHIGHVAQKRRQQGTTSMHPPKKLNFMQ